MGKGRTPHTLLGLPAACVGGVLALIGIIVTQNKSLNSRVSQDSEFRGSTTVRLKTIEDKLSGIEKSILTIRIGQASSGPISKGNTQDANQILESAKNSGVQLPPNVVEQSGKNFITAASKEPKAWDTALRFAEYRSYLNTFDASLVPSTKITTTQYIVNSPNGSLGPTLSIAGTLPAEKAARFNEIGQGLKTNTDLGNAYIVARGEQSS